MCIFDDLVEFTQQASLPLFDTFLTKAISFIGDSDPSVRQAAVYGMGIFSVVGGQKISPFIPGILVKFNKNK